ncbi:hypothetical protein CASFOL_025291 [Castilleja foliolosa]|uniref:Uncharacterized protein n=1 Tax=Castilleja foliolosa TaxID=1961234 RepID=A0ABD3CRR0_9LAMI
MASLGIGRRSTPSTAWMVHQDWIRRRRVMLGVTKSIIGGEGSSRQRDKVVVAWSCAMAVTRRGNSVGVSDLGYISSYGDGVGRRAFSGSRGCAGGSLRWWLP